MKVHETRPILVWADVDVGIADLVEHLQRFAGVRTLTSCQGTVDEGGAEPYAGYVRITWRDDKVLAKLKRLFDVEVEGECYGMLRLKPGTAYKVGDGMSTLVRKQAG
jgi:hypothetical protein